MRSLLISLISLIFSLSMVERLPAGEDYFLLVFGSQRIPNQPSYSHTFATFVKVSWPGNGPPCGKVWVEPHTISWLPATMVIRPFALLPECGHNYDLESTLRFAYDSCDRVSMWGPYRIQPDLYCRAVKQIGLLESGEVSYKANDAGYRTDEVSNCIHAVSSIAEGIRLRVVVAGWGEGASYDVLQRLEKWVVDKNCTHAWVGAALGLERYPIIYRDWQNPRSNAIVGPTYRLFGGERDLQATYGPPQSRSCYGPGSR